MKKEVIMIEFFNETIQILIECIVYGLLENTRKQVHFDILRGFSLKGCWLWTMNAPIA